MALSTSSARKQPPELIEAKSANSPLAGRTQERYLLKGVYGPEFIVKENRRHVRLVTRARCWCEGNQVTVYAPVVNLSEGGLCLRTLTPFEVEAQLRLRLALGEDEEVELSARVVWQSAETTPEPAGLGLCFEPLSSTAKSRLRRYVQQQLQMAPNAISH